MKILVTGSSGTLATDLYAITSEHKCSFWGVDKRPSKSTNTICDISDFLSVQKIVDEFKPDAIFHLAAETNVDLCEQNKLLSSNVNFVSTKNLVDLAKQKDMPFIFISSASIFNGYKDFPYSETSLPEPSNFYALTKLLSEQYIIQNLQKYIILRIGWLVGNPFVDHKFFGNVFTKIKRKEQFILGDNHQLGSLSFASEVSSVILKLYNDRKWGIYHLASKGFCTRHDIIEFILSYYKLNNIISLKEASANDFQLVANRPEKEILDTTLIESFGIKISSWETDLANYLRKFRGFLDEQ